MSRQTNRSRIQSSAQREFVTQEYSVELIDLQILDDLSKSKNIERFDAAVSSYFESKSREADPKSFDAILEDALESEKLAEVILGMPALNSRQVLTKLSVIDSELLNDFDCEAPVDRRHILAFASLKADIVRLLARMDL